MTTREAVGRSDWDRALRAALIAGAAGLLLFGLGALVSRDNLTPVLRSYLVAWCFWLGIALGSLAVVMLQYLTGGAWGLVLRRLLESCTRTLPLLALLFVPILLGLPRLYEWVESHDPTLAEKQRYYLNVPFFLARAAVYFAIWLAMAFLLNRWSRQQDEANEPRPGRRFGMLSAPGLALYGLTITFASIDWVMSLEPHWYSSIFGVLFGFGQVLSGFAFAVAALALLADRPPLKGVLTTGHLRDLGSMLMAFVMVWAYLHFSQFLIIWAGNLPEEVPWYLKRLRGGWQWLGLALVLFHFALPFLLLLSSEVKRSRRPLLAVAMLILLMRVVDLFWLIVPAHDDPHGASLAPHWPDVLLCAAALIGMGGLWLALFLWQLGRRPLLPAHDPVLLEVPEHA